jgi:hypothetical protein
MSLSSPTCLYVEVRSRVEKNLPPTSTWRESSVQGSGCTLPLVTEFRRHSRGEPSFFVVKRITCYLELQAATVCSFFWLAEHSFGAAVTWLFPSAPVGITGRNQMCLDWLSVWFLCPLQHSIGECDTLLDYFIQKMGLKYRTYLEGRKVYGCQNCRSHLANSDGLISKVKQSWRSYCSAGIEYDLTWFYSSFKVNMGKRICFGMLWTFQRVQKKKNKWLQESIPSPRCSAVNATLKLVGDM